MCRESGCARLRIDFAEGDIATVSIMCTLTTESFFPLVCRALGHANLGWWAAGSAKSGARSPRKGCGGGHTALLLTQLVNPLTRYRVFEGLRYRSPPTPPVAPAALAQHEVTSAVVLLFHHIRYTKSDFYNFSLLIFAF
jgi:hypothetical protein